MVAAERTYRGTRSIHITHCFCPLAHTRHHAPNHRRPARTQVLLRCLLSWRINSRSCQQVKSLAVSPKKTEDMSTAAVDDLGVPELDSHNWATWSMRMQSILVISDIWSVTHSESIFSTEDPRQYNEIEQHTLNIVLKAKAKILLRVLSKLVPHINHCETMHQVWTKLHDLLTHSSIQQAVFLQKEFHNLRKMDQEDIESFIDRVMDLVGRFREDGIATSDTVVTYQGPYETLLKTPRLWGVKGQ